jgi:hypothetical protein
MNVTELIRSMPRDPDVDLENRILRQCVIATIGLATDGNILLPQNVRTENYMANPEVFANHGLWEPGAFAQGQIHGAPVIGRCLSLAVSQSEIVTETQFAATPLGREYAYLYGCNEKKETYMRGWSIRVEVLESRKVSERQAQALAAEYWDPAIAEGLKQRRVELGVILRANMREYSAVGLGADRNALSRAAADGVAVAGAIVARLDLCEARTMLAELKVKQEANAGQIARLEQEIQALRGEGASAAARGDSEAILAAVRFLRETVNGRKSA